MENKNLQKINDKFVEYLKYEKNPNWVSIYLKKACGAYRSYLTNKPYSLGNSFMLAMSGVSAGWFATFNQIKSLGGSVKKGAKAKTIIFWSSGTKETENEDGEKEKHRFMVLKAYNVFNVETDAEGIVNKWNKPDPNAVEVHNDEIPDAEVPYREYCKREGIDIVSEDQGCAFYSPSRDVINIPAINNIVNSLEYYSAIYHECGHSTGAEKRLNRKKNSKISSRANYAREELVAEFTAILSMNALNIATAETENNSFAYLASFAKRAFGCNTIEAWQTALNEDPYLIYGSIEKADKAFKMIFNIHDEPVKE